MEQQLSEEETQKLWNEEAAKLEAGDNTPAFEAQGTVPVDPPQEDPQPQAAAPDQGQEADPLAGLPEPVKQALARITELETANSQLLHHVKTAEGRVAAMQREFQQVMQQRLADLQTQTGQWQQRRDDAEAELEAIAGQIAAADEQAVTDGQECARQDEAIDEDLALVVDTVAVAVLAREYFQNYLSFYFHFFDYLYIYLI